MLELMLANSLLASSKLRLLVIKSLVIWFTLSIILRLMLLSLILLVKVEAGRIWYLNLRLSLYLGHNLRYLGRQGLIWRSLYLRSDMIRPELIISEPATIAVCMALVSNSVIFKVLSSKFFAVIFCWLGLFCVEFYHCLANIFKHFFLLVKYAKILY